MDHNVRIALRSKNIYNVCERLEEIFAIKEWLDELVLWDKNMYSMKYLGSSNSLDVWFHDEDHALICALRWV